MAETAYNIISPIEQLFAAVGLVSSASRAVFGLALGGLVWFAFKPSSTIDQDGKLKPFKPLAKEGEDGTYFPWWAYPLVGALLFGFVI